MNDQTVKERDYPPTCKRCNGKGFIPEPEVWRAGMRDRYQRTCPDCLGVGTTYPIGSDG